MSETFRPAFEGRARPSVSYGTTFTDAVAKHASSTFNDASRIYILASASLARDTAHLSDLRAKLGPKVAGVRVGMRPHTYWSEILAIVSEARVLQVDLLVTLGAGSLTDASKIISFALANDVSSPDALESLCPSSPKKRPEEAIQAARVPIVCVPTSLAGGEYSPFAGATNDADGRKYSFSGPGLRCPALVILDPALALSTPPRIWLSTGVKAVDHCVETLCSLQSDEGADGDARKGLGKLVPALLRCAADKDAKDEGARLESQLGVVDAMSACSRGVPLGASHGIGHQLGPAGVGHGETSCLLMPAVCTFNYRRAANRARQDAVRDLLWENEQARELFLGKGLAREETELGGLLDVFVRALGLPRTLSEFGIGEDKLDGIAEHSLQDRWVKTNPAPLDKEGVLEILRMVLI